MINLNVAYMAGEPAVKRGKGRSPCRLIVSVSVECLLRSRTTDTNHGQLICCAEYFLKVSQIKLFRQALLPAGDVFMPL